MGFIPPPPPHPDPEQDRANLIAWANRNASFRATKWIKIAALMSLVSLLIALINIGAKINMLKKEKLQAEKAEISK